MKYQYVKPCPILVPNVTDTLDEWGRFVKRNVDGDPRDYDQNGDLIVDDDDD